MKGYLKEDLEGDFEVDLEVDLEGDKFNSFELDSEVGRLVSPLIGHYIAGSPPSLLTLM